MYKFKSQYENDSIVYKGRLITKRNLTKSIAEELLKVPSLAVRIEKVEEVEQEKEAPKAIVKPKKTRSKKAE